MQAFCEEELLFLALYTVHSTQLVLKIYLSESVSEYKNINIYTHTHI